MINQGAKFEFKKRLNKIHGRNLEILVKKFIIWKKLISLVFQQIYMKIYSEYLGTFRYISI